MVTVDFVIKENNNTSKSRQKYLEDDYFNQLIDLTVKYHDNIEIHALIRDLFTLVDLTEYETFFEKYTLIHKDTIKAISDVFNIFCEWKPYQYYNLGNCRGVFFRRTYLSIN